MFKDKLLETLNPSKTNDKENRKTKKAINKIQRQRKLSSAEFLKVYDTLWKEGPKVKYQSPDTWRDPEESNKSA